MESKKLTFTITKICLGILLLIQTTLCKLKGIMLVEIFRHGARNPFQNLLNTTYYDTYGSGALFENGMRQHFMLGS
jgi:Histidine phosphatase superfamily (branch 2)